MSIELRRGYVPCPRCGSHDIQFVDVERHSCQDSADLSFLCGGCNTTNRYSITNINGELLAVWSDITEDL